MCNYWFNRKLLEQLFLFFLPDAVTKNYPYFVKIIPLKRITAFWHCESVGFALQKSRFYRVKPTLLQRKTTRFITR